MRCPALHCSKWLAEFPHHKVESGEVGREALTRAKARVDTAGTNFWFGRNQYF